MILDLSHVRSSNVAKNIFIPVENQLKLMVSIFNTRIKAAIFWFLAMNGWQSVKLQDSPKISGFC